MKFLKGFNITIVFVLLFVLAVAAAAFSFTQYQKSASELKKLKENPRTVATEEAKKLVEDVSKLVALPEKETPTVATVTDASKLKDQPFFARSQNGDKVLIYTEAKKAYLYRPSINKVIEVAPVNIGTGSQQGVAGTKTQKVSVVLYNGTTTAGLTNSVGEKLQSELDNIEIVGRENASRDDYEGATVVDLSGRQSSVAERIAELLDGQVGSLPSGENGPDADILVILGSRSSSTEEATPTSSPTSVPN